MNPKPPPEFSRLPLHQLKTTQLAKLERHYYRLLRTLNDLRKTLPGAESEYERANACWHALYQDRKRRIFLCATREEVLWTVFVPYSYGTEEVSRTEHYTIRHWWRNHYPLFGTPWRKRDSNGAADKAWRFDVPWLELRNLLARECPKPLACAA